MIGRRYRTKHTVVWSRESSEIDPCDWPGALDYALCVLVCGCSMRGLRDEQLVDT